MLMNKVDSVPVLLQLVLERDRKGQRNKVNRRKDEIGLAGGNRREAW